MTTICNFIQFYESIIWHYLTDVFSYKLKGSELGITNDLIYRIVKFYNGRPLNCEVFAFNEKVNEKVRGADIDLFIEINNSGNYYHFMLQAKIMNYTGRYYDIENWSIDSQYDRLIYHANIEKAFPLYLLYNGRTVNSNITNNNDLGLSIVNANEIRRIKIRQINLPITPRITFNQLINHGMRNFHVLFCDIPDEYIPTRTVKATEIFKGYPYIKIDQNNDLDTTVEFDNEDLNDNNAINIIKDRHLAQYRIIINSTEKI